MNSAIVALYGYLQEGKAAVAAAEKAVWLWAIPAAGAIVCLAWIMLLASYRSLNGAKFGVLTEMEADLPVKLFTRERAIYKQNRRIPVRPDREPDPLVLHPALRRHDLGHAVHVLIRSSSAGSNHNDKLATRAGWVTIRTDTSRHGCSQMEFSEPTIFISYSRGDGRAFAEAFEKRLEDDAGIRSWRDLKSVEGGEDILPQVLRAIEQVKHLVLILTRRALASDWVRREWTHAREKGRKVSPVLADPSIKRSDLPSLDPPCRRLRHRRSRALGRCSSRFSGDRASPPGALHDAGLPARRLRPAAYRVHGAQGGSPVSQ